MRYAPPWPSRSAGCASSPSPAAPPRLPPGWPARQATFRTAASSSFRGAMSTPAFMPGSSDDGAGRGPAVGADDRRLPARRRRPVSHRRAARRQEGHADARRRGSDDRQRAGLDAVSVFDFDAAIVRSPGASVVDGLRQGDHDGPDFAAVAAEHRAYVAALEDAGLAVEVLPAL